MGGVGPASLRLADPLATTVSGRVFSLGETQVPLMGAMVCLRPEVISTTLADRALTVVRRHTCARTDSSGNWDITVMVDGRYVLTASAPYHTPEHYRGPHSVSGMFDLPAGAVLSDLDFTLKSGAFRLSGIVEDATGGVVSGASVFATVAPQHTMGSAEETDDEGVFSLWTAPGKTHIQVFADGYAPAQVEASAPGVGYRIRLLPESILSGHVVDHRTGSPVSHAEVYAGWPGRHDYAAKVISDEDGNFRITALASGIYKPWAMSANGYGLASRSVSLPLGTLVDDVVIELHPGVSVEAQVNIDRPGSACRAGRVSLLEGTQGLIIETAIQLNGHVRFIGVPPGAYHIEIACSDAVIHIIEGQLNVGPVPLSALQWTVPGAFSIQGVITDMSGEGLPNVVVDARPSQPGPRSQGSSSSTGMDGSFLISGLLPETYKLSTRSDFYLPLEDAIFLEVKKSLTDVAISLRKGGEVQGRVIAPDASAVAGIGINAVRENFSSESATSGPDGSFRLSGLPAGSYILELSGQFEAQPQQELRTVSVDLQRATNMVLIVEPATARITGCLTDDHGTPLADVNLRAVASDVAQRQAPVVSVSDLDGCFRLEPLRSGAYTVFAQSTDGVETVKEDVLAGEELHIILPPPVLLGGHVSSPGGAPSSFDITLEAHNGKQHYSEHFFRTSGEWAMQVAPGEYTVTAQASSGIATLERIDVQDARRDLRLELKPLASYRGRLFDSITNIPIVGMRVTALDASPPRLGDVISTRNVSNVDGYFEIDLVSGVSARLMLMPAGPAAIPYDISSQSVQMAPEGGDLGIIKLVRRRSP